MREALHILRKDLFSLRRLIFVAAVYLAIAAWADGFAWEISRLQDIVPMLGDLLVLILAGWMVAIAVYAEALPGSNQSWLTRPYHRRSLLAAKLIFVLVTVNLPVLLFQCLELIGRGYSPLHFWDALLVKQLLLAQFFVTTIVIIASCTKNLGQSIYVIVLVVMWSVTRESIFFSPFQWTDWRASTGIQQYTFAIIDAAFCGGLLWFQYRTRRTLWTRGLLAFNIIMLPWLVDKIPISGPAWSLQSRWSGGKVASDTARISLNRSVYPATLSSSVGDEGRLALFPIRFEALPDGVIVKCESDEIKIVPGSGISWMKDRDTPCGLLESPHGHNLGVVVDAAFAEAAGNIPVHLHAKLNLVLLQRKERVRLGTGITRVRAPGDGICQRLSDPGPVRCYWPLRQPPLFIASPEINAPVDKREGPGSNYFHPITTRSGALSPMPGVFSRSAAQMDFPVLLESYEPIALVERELDVPKLELSTYLQPRPPSHATSWTIFTHFLKRLVPHL